MRKAVIPLALLALAAMACSPVNSTPASSQAATPTRTRVPPSPTFTPAPPSPVPTRLRPAPSPVFPATPNPTPPTPESIVPIPPRPSQFADWPDIIHEFANQGGVVGALLYSWGPEEGAVHRADSDDDGMDELLVFVSVLGAHTASPESEFLILDWVGGRWEMPLVAGRHLPGLSGTQLSLWRVGDINADGRNETLFRDNQCGAHTCLETITIIQWNGTSYARLEDGSIGNTYPSTRLEDEDGDGVQEILVHGGAQGSPGSGPNRLWTDVWSWDGSSYSLRRREYDPPEYLIHQLQVGDELLWRGDLEGAIKAYDLMIGNPALVESGMGAQGERDRLEAFTRFRLLLCHLLSGRPERAAALLDSLRISDPTENQFYAGLGEVTYQSGLAGDDPSDICGAAREYAWGFEELPDPFLDYGYANLAYRVDVNLCPY